MSTSCATRPLTILLFGKNGQVGSELHRILAPYGRLIALDRQGEDGLCGDMTDLDGIAATIAYVKPDLIFNATAYTAVDKAESEPELCHTINVEAPRAMARAAKAVNALLVHYSTDYVFNGEGETPFVETDPTGPLNVYGGTKLFGEEAIREEGARHLICRTSWVYGVFGKNFMKTILRLAKTKTALNVVEDQVGAPTSAEFIADYSLQLALKTLQNPALEGTYHLVPCGTTNWCEFARWIVRESASADGFVLMPDAIKGIPSSEYPTPATRPLNSRLDNTKLREALAPATIHCWETYAARVLRALTEPI